VLVDSGSIQALAVAAGSQLDRAEALHEGFVVCGVIEVEGRNRTVTRVLVHYIMVMMPLTLLVVAYCSER
jgi:hypothetical protein